MTQEMVISYRFVRISKIHLPLISYLRIIRKSLRPCGARNGNILQIYTHLKYFFAADLAAAYNSQESPSLRRKKWKYLTDLYAISKIHLPPISHLRIIHESISVPMTREMVISYRFVRNLKNSPAADLASAYNS